MQNFNDNNKWKGVWDCFITEGTPLSLDELSAIKAGKSIGRSFSKQTFHNVITTIGRAQINKAMSGGISSVNEIKLTKQQLGTGTNTPAAGDTALQTPSAPTLANISSASYSNEQQNILCVWAAGAATGTWKELGIFMNDTILFSHVGIDITATAAQAITIDGTITQSL